MAAKVGDTWYRIEDRAYGLLDWDTILATRLSLNEITFRVCKVTPKGVRLVRSFEFENGYVPKHARFVSETSRKRYAHPTLAEAYEGFVSRKTAQQRILRAQLDRVTQAKDMALGLCNKMKGLAPAEPPTV